MSKQGLMAASELRPHWVCHFQFWDGPLTGLVEIDGQHFWARHNQRMKRAYSLMPVVLDDECRSFLEDYRATYHHCFYHEGQREAFDGRPLCWFSEKWNGRNPIEELARQREDVT